MSKRDNWFVIPDYEGHEIDSRGRVRNIQTGNILRTSVNQYGARYVSLRNTTKGQYENKALSVLVAQTFCDNHTEANDTVLHLDGDTQNNEASNLMWASRWHTLAYHREINNINKSADRRRVQELGSGRIFKNIADAARHTGCLPSAIDYSLRYNDNLDSSGDVNFIHRTFPGGYMFKYA